MLLTHNTVNNRQASYIRWIGDNQRKAREDSKGSGEPGHLSPNVSKKYEPISRGTPGQANND